MNQLELTKKVFTLIEEKNTAAAAQYLSEDFTFSGPVPEPVSGAMWLGLHDKLNAAFSNFSFNLGDLKMENGCVSATVQLSGTHTAALDATALGLPVFPATGKSIHLPKEPLMVEFQGEKICSIAGERVPGGGMQGILSQIGVAVPVQ